LESTMEYLIEKAKQSKIFTIDTKRDYLSDIAALIQVECTGDTSVLMLFECWHLPDSNSYLFRQVCRLFSTILDPTNEIQAWGDIHKELLPFLRFNIFSKGDIHPIHSLDIQQLFREWYNRIFPHLGDCCPSDVSLQAENSISIHPTDYDLNLSLVHEQYDYSSCVCPHRPYKNPNEDWTLHTAVTKTFQESLDTTYISSPWGLGLDQALGTYIPLELVGRKRYHEMENQKDYRRQLINHAVNDCLSITKLSVAIRNQWSSEHLKQYIQHHRVYNDVIDIHRDKNLSILPTLPDVRDQLHVHVSDVDHNRHQINDYEPISDDELPHITTTIATSPIHESPVDSEMSSKKEPVINNDRKKKRSQEAIHRRCKKRNAIRRAHRHDFDIVRTVYRSFKIQQVEQVLDNLHIRRRHCHIRRRYQLHIGLHSSEDQIRYDQLLNDQYFTKMHFDAEFGSPSLS
jgi:predicted transposase YbfD/YdcC